jgi:predicted ATPase with chaperone activity
VENDPFPVLATYPHPESDYSRSTSGTVAGVDIAAAGGHNLLMVEPIKPFPMRHTATGEWRLMYGPSAPSEISLAHQGVLFLDELPVNSGIM